MRLLRVIAVLSLIAGIALTLGVTPTPTLAANITITDCTQAGLAQAVDDAATTDPNNPGLVTFNCPNPTIAFSSFIFIDGDAQTTAVTIDGSNNGNPIILDGNNATCLFRIDTGASVTIQHMTLQNGRQTDGTEGGAIDSDGTATVTVIDTTFIGNEVDGFGGAIDNSEGALTVINSTFNNNQAAFGGALSTFFGPITVSQSTFTSNTASSGGAISNLNDSTLTVSQSSFIINSAYLGGAIYNDVDSIDDTPGITTISQSLFTSNTAETDGGAIETYGELTVQRSSFLNNHSNSIGGAIDAWDGSVSIIASTMSGNTADGEPGDSTGSTIFINDLTERVLIVGSTIVQPENSSPAIHINNSDALTLEGVILGGSGQHCEFNGGSLTDVYTFSNDNSCELSDSTSRQNISDLLLGPLTTTTINGVDQSYYPLLEDSPAVDAGPIGCDTDIFEGPDPDQLGNPRPYHYFCDIGAIESPFATTLLCANTWNGALRLTDTFPCARSETIINMAQNSPLALCVNNWNSSTRLSDRCTRSEHPITVTGDHTIPICVNRYNAALRVTTRCTRSEHQSWL